MMAGHKQWTSGELVTAADMQSYLQNQVIGVYADSTVRDAQIPVPVAGQHAYLTSTATMTWWTGSRWAGDTGRRNIAGELTSGWKVNPGGAFEVRRVGRVVEIVGYNIDATDATDNVMWPFPVVGSGFGVRTSLTEVLFAGSTAGTATFHLAATGLSSTNRTQNQCRLHLTYVTDDPWPATIPGVAALGPATGLDHQPPPSIPEALPTAEPGTLAVLEDNTIAVRTRTGGWVQLATSALPGSTP